MVFHLIEGVLVFDESKSGSMMEENNSIANLVRYLYCIWPLYSAVRSSMITTEVTSVTALP